MPRQKPNTHLKICADLCGRIVEITEKGSIVTLTVGSNMVVDDTGLIHGGFIFGLADYAAMVAVNHPNVVLGAANVKFLKPVKAGETLVATASKQVGLGRKMEVKVDVSREDISVFSGDFTCFVLDKHVLN
ncbi:MAG: thioesterase superfamily protein [Promethearchaeota archaeon CR_4]|nr:MAG: thioesterase superfamily protein [Candidatus Lokiarchaeota archaeon CR_4]